MSILVANGLYKLKDCYFTEFGNALMMDNKQESRPYYYLYQDPEGIDWAIPLSSQVNNYRRKIAAIEAKRGKGKCVYYYIGKIASVDRVFLISDMLPIEPKYIKDQFTINGQHYVSQNSNQIKTVRSKATRYLKLIQSGSIQDRLGVLEIKSTLMERRK